MPRSNAFVQLVSPTEEFSAPATSVTLVDGLEARSVHAWPRASFDIWAGLQAFARVLPAGFYYKTFIGSGGNAWPRFEPFIRRLAGLGHAPVAPDLLPSETRNEHVDVVVVGAGPAGLAAAQAAARGGASVLVVEDGLARHPETAAGRDAPMPFRIFGFSGRRRCSAFIMTGWSRSMSGIRPSASCATGSGRCAPVA